MKTKLLFVLLFIFTSNSSADFKTQLVEKDGLKYKVGYDKKFTGIYTGKTQDNKDQETCYIQGKKNGVSIIWHENRQKKIMAHFKDNKLHGLMTRWHKNGNIKTQTTFVEGEPNGLMTEWYDSGRKKSETNFVNGEPIGTQDFMYENGIKVF